MKKIIILCICVWSLYSFNSDSFKTQQLQYSRVRNAYSLKESGIRANLSKNKISIDSLEIYIRIFKTEKILELWGKNKSSKEFCLLQNYNICANSGVIGPKRKQGDYQVPEGFYHINAFNPVSNFHLSMMINYPNSTDRILGYKPNLGGQICIHGSCVTIGCVPLTDTYIQELYVYCIEATKNGQSKIPVTIFPCKLTDENFSKLQITYKSNYEFLGLWEDLKQAYSKFNTTKKLPSISFLPNGRHSIK